LTREQIELRRQGLTATDMSAVAGVNPWRSWLDVYVDKVVQPPEPKGAYLPTNEAIELGIALEPWLINHYQEQHPELGVCFPQTTFQHPKFALALATPDGVVYENEGTVSPRVYEGGPQRVFEGKTAGLTGGASRISREWGEPGTDAVPRPYLIQCHWQAMVLEVDRCDLAALIGNLGYREYVIRKDEELWGLLREMAEQFWTDHVVARKPPEPGPSEDAARALQRLYPDHSKDLLESTEEIDETACLLCFAERWQKQMDAHVNELRNSFRAVIADAYGIQGEWGKVLWPKSKDRDWTDYKAVAEEIAAMKKVGKKTYARIIEEHTEHKPGGRTLRAYWNEDHFNGTTSTTRTERQG
jgi:putative phage-type endonuclease